MKAASTIRRKTQRGSALLEGAVISLGFLAIIIGALDFSRAAFAYSQVQWVAGDGARYAGLRGSTTGTRVATSSSIATYVKGNMIALDTTQATVTTTWSPNNTPGSTVAVQVDYLFSPTLIPFLNVSMTLRGTGKSTILE